MEVRAKSEPGLYSRGQSELQVLAQADNLRASGYLELLCTLCFLV